MNIKTILALCAMASMATTAPAEDLEKRACGTKNRFCCETFFPFNILFVRAVGSNCIGPTSATCPAGKKEACCTSNLPLNNGNLACTQL
ncbi:hypothetical protein BDV34DRAFT_229358 [Aspergillus parasiticus]|uniref:Uncharacterized protein n=2 Tax=Aspergillus subgen. Circumdati TaxID=2720871 RepID=A0A5N6D8V3_ASPPA|nr:hypothetical protein BDV34DRAFT_229358 [Aspergillus parasiticus]KAE8317702.1 hypothetical protein BDV41DRAFT_572581 [Aspergillus transmontanensis]